MRFLVLNGSPRKNGVTTQVLTKAYETLKANHEGEYVDLYDLEIKPCVGCLQCRPDKTCVLPRDGAHEVAEKIKQADLLVVGTPTYWGNMTGVMKNLFDRCVPVFEYLDGFTMRKNLRGKKAMIVIPSGAPFPFNMLRSQSRGTASAVKTVLRSGGVKIVDTIYAPNSRRFEENRGKVMERLARGLRAFA